MAISRVKPHLRYINDLHSWYWTTTTDLVLAIAQGLVKFTDFAS